MAKKDKEDLDVPVVSISDIARSATSIGVASFNDLKVKAMTLKKPILRLPRIGNKQRFIVLDEQRKYYVDVEIKK